MPAKNPKKKLARHNTNQVRVIAGEWRGRKLGFPDTDGLRPTGDRMRETLFNWLNPYIYQSRVLDLFAGSGVLGIEALSRGANNCIFVETEANVAKALVQNLEILRCDRGKVVNRDAFDMLGSLASNSIDLLFLDPPFDSHLHSRILEMLCHHRILAQSALVYIEAPFDETIEIPVNWSLLKEKTSGQVRFSLYRAEARDSG